MRRQDTLHVVCSIIGVLAVIGAFTTALPTAANAAEDDCKIALLLPENSDVRFDQADRPFFIEEVAKRAPNCEVLYYNAANDPVQQQQQAETALTQGAKVLVVDAVNQASAATIVALAQKRNVKTVAHDRVINGPVALRVTFDNVSVGQLQAKTLVDAMKAAGHTSGDIVMINGEPSSSGSQAFRQGAHSVFDESGFTIAAEYDTVGWSPETAATEMAQAVTKVGKDNIVGVYIANDTMAGAAINAMRQAGITDLPPVTGQDANPDALQRILLGTQYMTVYKPLKRLNSVAADAAVALAMGKDLAMDTVQQTNPSGNEYPAVIIAPVAVTAENIKSTVIADGFTKVDAICNAQTMSACKEHGIVE
jgi:D-xylose transport system substrate-binding protein